MKYEIGDKLRYDGGDWWFYGTVSAVFEHSICPCYRLSVERMEKKSCKFSITQFEFDLEADQMIEEKQQTITREPKPETDGFPFDAEKNKVDDWDKHLEEWKKGDKKSIPVQQWRQKSIGQFVEGKLSADRIAKLREVGILK